METWQPLDLYMGFLENNIILLIIIKRRFWKNFFREDPYLKIMFSKYSFI